MTDPGKKPSVATTLVELALGAGIVPFHSQGGDPFVRVDVDGHRETWPIKSQGFRLWLTKLYYDHTQASAHAQALGDALACLAAKAVHEGEFENVFVRIGTADGVLYIDLADAGWRVIEITDTGWTVRDDAPVHFRRSAGTRALPDPVPGGDLAELRAFVNVTEDDWPLLVAVLVAAFMPTGPFPVLVLHGEQGSAKSTLARIVRLLVDPHQVPLRAEPRTTDDLMIAATHGWILALDNISALNAQLSDALCRLSTGGGLGKRMHYSNDEEIILSAARPVVLNGINEIVTRPDLLDRAVMLALPVIGSTHRLLESEFWSAFDARRPVILGGLCDLLVGVLRVLPTVRLKESPRMADFARVGVAVERVLRWDENTFLSAYAQNRAGAYALSLEESPIGAPLFAFLDAGTTWTGTSTALLSTLSDLVTDQMRRSPRWPQSPNALSGALKHLAPALRAAGIEISNVRRSRQRLIHLEATPQRATG